jgi:hypothetical protein
VRLVAATPVTIENICDRVKGVGGNGRVSPAPMAVETIVLVLTRAVDERAEADAFVSRQATRELLWWTVFARWTPSQTH